MKTVMELFGRLNLRSEKGQTVIEYILVLVLIALVLVIAFNSGAVASGISAASNEIGTALQNVDVPIT